jgi:hypothetical protein
MLIADDQRRWVTGNTAACDLVFIPPDNAFTEQSEGAWLARRHGDR